MKRILKSILSSVLLTILLCTAPVVMVSGCKSTPQQIAYKSLKSVQVASVAALKLYGDAYKRGEIDVDTKAKVHSLYAKYQAAFAFAETVAQFNYDQPATADVVAAANDLIQVIQSFRK